MDSAINRMIADLENIHALGDEKADLGTAAPPATIWARVSELIEQEVARVRTDCEGRVVEINPSFSAMCGFSFPEIKGRKPGSLLQGPETEQTGIATLRHALHTGTACDVEIFNYHKDGSRYRVWIHVEPLRDDAGQLTGFEALERKLL